jgi:hypothetical protein
MEPRFELYHVDRDGFHDPTAGEKRGQKLECRIAGLKRSKYEGTKGQTCVL